MPMMISLQKFLLSTTKGHMVRFEPNVPTYVDDEIVSDAMAKGCVVADESARPFFDQVARERVEFTGTLRSSLLTLAIADVAKENQPKTFDGAGLPKLDAIQKRLGFEVFKTERTEAFQTFMAAKKQKEEIQLHPDAKTVYEILRAENKDDLTKYVTPGDDLAVGLTTADLRKHLLVQYSGISPRV